MNIFDWLLEFLKYNQTQRNKCPMNKKHQREKLNVVDGLGQKLDFKQKSPKFADNDILKAILYMRSKNYLNPTKLSLGDAKCIKNLNMKNFCGSLFRKKK